MLNDEIRDAVLRMNEDAVLIDGHDDAIVGMVSISGRLPVVLYDPKIIMDRLVSEGMPREYAQDFIDFNIGCVFAGDGTPAMLIRLDESGGDHNEPDVEEDKP